MTEHITYLISEITVLNTEINIKVKNIVQVHLYKLGELRLNQDKMRNQFQMSRNCFFVALESKENELKKARENFYLLKKKMWENALVSLKYEDLQKEPLQECHNLHVSTV